MNIAEAVRELRKAYGEPQQRFSDRVGVALNSISRYETGEREPESLIRIKLGSLAREKGREDLYRVFAFGTDQLAEINALAREQMENLFCVLSPAKLCLDQWRYADAMLRVPESEKRDFIMGHQGVKDAVELLEMFLAK